MIKLTKPQLETLIALRDGSVQGGRSIDRSKTPHQLRVGGGRVIRSSRTLNLLEEKKLATWRNNVYHITEKGIQELEDRGLLQFEEPLTDPYRYLFSVINGPRVKTFRVWDFMK